MIFLQQNKNYENYENMKYVKITKSGLKNKIFDLNNAQIGPGPCAKDASRREGFDSFADLAVRPLSVEFRRFEVSVRISVPMLYITFW